MDGTAAESGVRFTAKRGLDSFVRHPSRLDPEVIEAMSATVFVPWKLNLAESSCGNDLVPRDVEPNHRRTIILIEVTADRVLCHRLQLLDGVGLREDGVPERASFVAALRGLLDNKDDFLIHTVPPLCNTSGWSEDLVSPKAVARRSTEGIVSFQNNAANQSVQSRVFCIPQFHVAFSSIPMKRL